MITLRDYFEDTAGVPDAHVANAGGLLDKVNALLLQFVNNRHGFTVRVNSGYRTVAHNATVPGAAPNSKHTTGNAIDIGDDSIRTLAAWCLNNVGLLHMIGLYCEDMRATPTWVHFQDIPPASRSRFFIPNAEWATKLGGVPLTIKSLHN